MLPFLIGLLGLFISNSAYAQGTFVRPACFHTPTWVQKVEGANAVTSDNATTGAFASAVGNGNFIVCAFDFQSNTLTITGVSDSKGNTWTRAAGPFRATTYSTYLYYAYNVTGGTGFTVTYTLSGANNNKFWTCHEYSGVAGAIDPLVYGTGAQGTSSGTTTTVGTTTAAEGKHLAVTYFGPITNGPPTVGSGYTARSTNFNNLFEDKLTTAAGSAIAGTVGFASGNAYYSTFAVFRCKP